MEFATTVYQSVRKTASDWFHYRLPKPLLEKSSVTFSWKEELEVCVLELQLYLDFIQNTIICSFPFLLTVVLIFFS